jgi:hypothetical protein
LMARHTLGRSCGGGHATNIERRPSIDMAPYNG